MKARLLFVLAFAVATWMALSTFLQSEYGRVGDVLGGWGLDEPPPPPLDGPSPLDDPPPPMSVGMGGRDGRDSNNNANNSNNNGKNFTDVQQRQIRSYLAGTALMVNVHITHHGGTAFCAVVGRATAAAPDFACAEDRTNTTGRGKYRYRGRVVYSTVDPWRSEKETSQRIQEIRLRHGYSMVAWEYDRQPRRSPLAATHWEHPDLVSVVVMRHPVDRLLAGDADVDRRWYPGMKATTSGGVVGRKGRGGTTNGGTSAADADANATALRQRENWWHYARRRDVRNTNNFALGILSQPGCCNGSMTDPSYLEQARALVGRFTFVLDIECLDDGMDELGRILNLTLNWGKGGRSSRRGRTDQIRSIRPSYRERIGHDDVYEYLVHENRLDIELYEWSKTISLVRC